MEIFKRTVRYSEKVEKLPDFKELKIICRLIHYDWAGEFESVQYLFRYENASYTVDLPLEEVEEFQKYLDAKMKSAGVNPKLALGTVQGYKGEVENVDQNKFCDFQS